MSLYLDTNICIYYLTGRVASVKDHLMEQSPADIKIASLVQAELLYGAEKSQQVEANKRRVELFLQPFEIIPFDSQAAQFYADIRSTLERTGTIIGPNDLIIAATVLSKNGILVTNNVKEFSQVPELQVIDWVST